MRKYFIPLALLSMLYACESNYPPFGELANNSQLNFQSSKTNTSASIKISFKDSKFPPRSASSLTEKVTVELETDAGKYSGEVNAKNITKIFYVPYGKIKVILKAFDKDNNLLSKVENNYFLELYSNTVREISFDPNDKSTIPSPTSTPSPSSKRVSVRISFKDSKFPPSSVSSSTNRITVDIETSEGKLNVDLNSIDKIKTFSLPNGKITIVFKAFDKSENIIATTQRVYILDSFTNLITEVALDSINKPIIVSPTSPIPTLTPTPNSGSVATPSPSSTPEVSSTVVPIPLPTSSPTASPSYYPSGGNGNRAETPDTSNSVDVDVEIIPDEELSAS